MPREMRDLKRKQHAQTSNSVAVDFSSPDISPLPKRRASERSDSKTKAILAQSKSSSGKKKTPKKSSDKKQDHQQLQEWSAECIIEETETQYLIKWADIDQVTGKPYDPTWEPKEHANELLRESWEKQKNEELERKEVFEAIENADESPESKVPFGTSRQSRVVPASSSPAPEEQEASDAQAAQVFTEVVEDSNHTVNSETNEHSAKEISTQDLPAESPMVAVPIVAHPSQYEYVGMSQLPITQPDPSSAISSSRDSSAASTRESTVIESSSTRQSSAMDRGISQVIPDSQFPPDASGSVQESGTEEGQSLQSQAITEDIVDVKAAADAEHEMSETSAIGASQVAQNDQPDFEQQNSSVLDASFTPEGQMNTFDAQDQGESEGMDIDQGQIDFKGSDEAATQKVPESSTENDEMGHLLETQGPNGAEEFSSGQKPVLAEEQRKEYRGENTNVLQAEARSSPKRPVEPQSDERLSDFQTQLPYYPSPGVERISDTGAAEGTRRASTSFEEQAASVGREGFTGSMTVAETGSIASRPGVGRSFSTSKLDSPTFLVGPALAAAPSPSPTPSAASTSYLLSPSRRDSINSNNSSSSRWAVTTSRGELTRIGQARAAPAAAPSKASIANLLNPVPSSSHLSSLPSNRAQIPSIPEERGNWNGSNLQVNGASPFVTPRDQFSDGSLHAGSSAAPLTAPRPFLISSQGIFGRSIVAPIMSPAPNTRSSKRSAANSSDSLSSIPVAPSQVPEVDVNQSLPQRPATPPDLTQDATAEPESSLADAITQSYQAYRRQNEALMQSLMDPASSSSRATTQNADSTQNSSTNHGLPLLSSPNKQNYSQEQSQPFLTQQEFSTAQEGHETYYSQVPFNSSSEQDSQNIPNTTLNTPSNEEYLLPLSLGPQTSKLYRDTFATNFNLVAFLERSTQSSEASSALEKAQEFLGKLHNITSHVDLDNYEALTQSQLNAPEVAASWDISLNCKFKFLSHFFESTRSADVHVLLLVKSGSLFEIVEKFLEGIKVSYTRHDQRKNTLFEHPLRVTLIPTGDIGAGIVVERADLVIGFDETFSFDNPLVREARKHPTNVNQLCPAVVLIPIGSLQHIMHISRIIDTNNIESVAHLISLVRKALYNNRGISKILPVPAIGPEPLGKLIGLRLLEQPQGGWYVPSIDDRECDLALPESRSGSFSSAASENAAPPAARWKRRLVDDDDDNDRQAKTPRLTPNVASSNSVTRISDTVIASTATDHSSAEIAKLQEEVNLLRSDMAKIEKELFDLQSRYEEQLATIQRFESEVQLNRATIKTSEDLKTARENTIVQLKEDIKKLKEELQEARQALAASAVPDLVELQELREKVRRMDSLEKKLSSANNEVVFFGKQYQDASVKALEHASTISNLEEELATLRGRAEGEVTKLRGLYQDNSLKSAQSTVRKEAREKEELKRIAERLAEDNKRLVEENKALKEREEKRAGMALSTRGSSVPPQKGDQLRPGTPGLTRGPSALARNAPMSGSGSRAGSRAGSRQGTPVAESRGTRRG